MASLKIWMQYSSVEMNGYLSGSNRRTAFRISRIDQFKSLTAKQLQEPTVVTLEIMRWFFSTF